MTAAIANEAGCVRILREMGLQALGFFDIWLRHISCGASAKLSASSIFGSATYPVAPRQCKLNKFICIALGF